MNRCVVLFSLFAITCLAQSVVINEVVSLNVSGLSDRDNDYPDWLEIYNPTSTTFNLQGYGLSDDAADPLKWTFPDISLAANDYLIVFASDKNRKSGPELHANFKIKSKGEHLLLASPNGAIVDSLSVPTLAVDVSYGRTPDGVSSWAYFVSPTPGAANNTESATGYSTPPSFSRSGGFYANSVTIELSSHNPDAFIRYTTDGADPGKSSRSYRSPININRTTVLKARTFEPDKLPSQVVAHTFFVDEKNDIPVVSISTHPDNFFDEDIGIYVVGNGTALGGYESNPIGPPANYWEDWERPIHIELYEPGGQLAFREKAGIKMSGKTTRKLPQKSFAIFMRSQYGKNELAYPLFPNYSVTTFGSFLLRNAGSDNTVNQGGVHFRDGLTALLLDGVDVDYQMYRPCEIYINGDYWGIYSIREKLNEEYLASHHGVDPDNVDMLDDYHTLYPLVIEGDAEDFNALIDYLKSHDLSNETYAEYVNTRMNVRNYLTYMAVQIFYANHDGPGHNSKFWRPRTEDGRYRWLLYDTDHSLGQRLFIPNFHYAPDAYTDNTIAYYREEDGPSWPNPPESTFIFRKMLENEKFTHLFISILTDLMNTVFQEDVTIPTYESTKNKIESAIHRHLDRWGGSYRQWQENTLVIEDFFINRQIYLQDYVIEEFDLGGLADVTLQIQPAGSGQIKINSLYIKENGSTLYFQDVPVQFTAMPNIGYRFAGWQEYPAQPESFSQEFTGDVMLTAQFEKVDEEDVLVINEINYNASADFNTEDWIELYNPTAKTIDVSGWMLADDDSSADYVFPTNGQIAPNEFIVLSRDPKRFAQYWPDIAVFGELPFGFSSAGDHLSLFNANGQIIDSLTYKNSGPWPWQPDGSGATLALRDANFDNSVAENWMASFAHGTPGAANKIIGEVKSDLLPHAFELKQAYPNPFNASTKIEFYLPVAEQIHLSIYDILGRHVKSIIDAKLSAGHHRFTWHGRNERDRRVSSGVYILRFANHKRSQTQIIALVY